MHNILLFYRSSKSRPYKTMMDLPESVYNQKGERYKEYDSQRCHSKKKSGINPPHNIR